MASKKTTEEFKKELAIKNPSIEVLGEYKNASIKILAMDKRCGHKWEVVPPSLLRGYGCPNKECIKTRQNRPNREKEENFNSWGSRMVIINYRGCDDLDVEFDNGYIIKHRNYRDFKKGYIEHPYDKTVYGIGYLGDGKYKAKVNDIISVQYYTWHGMLSRCYNEKTLKKQPTYKGCSVAEEWYNFQVFSKWYDEHYYEVDGQTMALDKDIKNKGNKVYSPNNCIIVPQCINTLFVKNDANRGKFPIGVSEKEDKYGFIYRARCNNILINRCVHLGYYTTPEKAYEQYKYYKEQHIKEVADYYQDQIPKELYDAMYGYEVEITD